jgi:putative endonuclease
MRLLGIKGEDLAVRFLRKKGYKILSRNYKTPLGEIDIIAEDGATLVFVEVKTRTDTSYGLPFEAVDRRKREKLRKVALYYLKNCLRKDAPSRFDVLSIQAGNEKNEIEHIMDAFE